MSFYDFEHKAFIWRDRALSLNPEEWIIRCHYQVCILKALVRSHPNRQIYLCVCSDKHTQCCPTEMICVIHILKEGCYFNASTYEWSRLLVLGEVCVCALHRHYEKRLFYYRKWVPNYFTAHISRKWKTWGRKIHTGKGYYHTAYSFFLDEIG